MSGPIVKLAGYGNGGTWAAPVNWLEAVPVHPRWCECDDCQLEDEAYARNEALDEDSENRLRGMTW
jgi:hypothetical protein